MLQRVHRFQNQDWDQFQAYLGSCNLRQPWLGSLEIWKKMLAFCQYWKRYAYVSFGIQNAEFPMRCNESVCVIRAHPITSKTQNQQSFQFGVVLKVISKESQMLWPTANLRWNSGSMPSCHPSNPQSGVFQVGNHSMYGSCKNLRVPIAIAINSYPS